MSLNKIANLLERLIATGGSLSLVNTALNDANGNEIIKTTATSSAVNEFTITNAATGGSPILGASGGDTNIGVRIQDKGTSGIFCEAPLLSLRSATAITTAGAATWTAANLLSSLVLRNCSGSSRTDTLPSAASLVAALPGVTAGQSFWVVVRNTSTAAETLTLSMGSGGTASGTMTVQQNTSRLLLVVIDNATTSSEAYTVYSVGSLTT